MRGEAGECAEIVHVNKRGTGSEGGMEDGTKGSRERERKKESESEREKIMKRNEFCTTVHCLRQEGGEAGGREGGEGKGGRGGGNVKWCGPAGACAAS